VARWEKEVETWAKETLRLEHRQNPELRAKDARRKVLENIRKQS